MHLLQAKLVILREVLFLFVYFDSMPFSRCSPGNNVVSAEASKDGVLEARQIIEKCSQSTFRSVTELSQGSERSFGLATVDMVCFLLAKFAVLTA